MPLVNGSSAKGRDLEEGDFDENELDNLHSSLRRGDMEANHYDLASDSEDDDTEIRAGGKGKQ